jgi:hypothetical protein
MTPDPTTLTILGSMGAAIGVMWKHTTGNIEKVQTKLDECEEDRKALHLEQKNLWMVIAKHAGKGIEELKGDKE